MTDTLPDTTEAPLDDDSRYDAVDALDSVLQEMQQQCPEIPHWEFCEGFLTALICTRDEVPESEWLPALLGDGVGGPHAPFASEGQRTRFLMNWQQRHSQITQALQAPVDRLDDERALHPATLDWRGMFHMAHQQATARGEPLPPQAEAGLGDLLSYGQLWAMGFMAAVDNWPQHWSLPRDKDMARDMQYALESLDILCQDDTAAPTLNLLDEQAPPSVSEQRMQDFGDALWAVYDLYDIARARGPAQAPHRRPDTPGRNDPCSCGSGRKYKKCCGAH